MAFIYGFDFNVMGSMYFSSMSIVTITDVRLYLYSSRFVGFGASGMGTHEIIRPQVTPLNPKP